MSVKHAATVANYRIVVSELKNGLANLTEFVNTLPMPNEQGHLESIDYGFVHRVQEMHRLLAQVIEHSDKASGKA